jgi:CopG family transcriptional regulator, nickel-responsive regulator
MAIVSLSLPGRLLDELDALTESGGFGNRSDTVRSAIKLLASEQRQQHSARGEVSAVLLLVHDERDEAAFAEARHRFEDIIKTLIHNHLHDGKCLEIFILEGDVKKLNELIETCRKSKKADYVKLIVA